MRCTCCDRNLSDFESTRKSKSTGEYLDMCNTCYRTVQDAVPAVESMEVNYDEEPDFCVDYALYDEDEVFDDD